MRCLACNRPLLRYAASIQTRDGLRGWGPTCAKAVVIRPTRTRWPVIESQPRRRVVADESQLDWIETA